MKKKKIILAIFLTAIISIGLQSFHENDLRSPCDSPIVGDHTGAPGETDCTGCHVGSPNTGSGMLEFHVGNDSTYVPGQTYSCNVKVTQAGLDKFGFVNVALRNSNNATTGTFIIIDSVNTRKFTSGGRNYFSHTPCGADADTVGSNEWNYSWTAPATNVGSITLYISSLAANHNHATTGDDTYTTTVTLLPVATAIEEIPGLLESLTVFPNPVSDFISISYQNLSSGLTEIKLVDIRGRTIEVLFSGTEGNGQIKKSFSLKELELAEGVYWLNITKENRQVNKKIILL